MEDKLLALEKSIAELKDYVAYMWYLNRRIKTMNTNHKRTKQVYENYKKELESLILKSKARNTHIEILLKEME